jgi:lysophospholipase L1-like esterase
VTDGGRVGRYVALGDSFTEGVGDPSKHLPNGVRGWADRVAEKLAREQPGWEYANLAVRSKRLRHIIADQVAPAVSVEPTLVSVYAGGNDIMDLGTDVRVLLERYEHELVAPLAATGARVLLFTGYDVEASALLRPLRKRNHLYNDGVRRIARQYGATLVDYWSFDAYQDPRMWASDRLHMSKAGHKYLAARVLEILDVPHSVAAPAWEPLQRTLREWERDQRRWMLDWVFPLAVRKVRGVTLGDALQPRWPTPVRVPPRGGLRKLAKRNTSRRGG